MSFTYDLQQLTGTLTKYYQESLNGNAPVINQHPIGAIHDDLNLARWAEEGGLKGKQLATFLAAYFPHTTRLYHPHYMAHQVAVPDLTGALGAFVDGFTNQPMSIYEMGPGAAAIEFFMVNWLLEKIGWAPMPLSPNVDTRSHGGGALTHGGSMATLTALICARSHLVENVWDQGVPKDLVVLSPETSHYAISRAIGIMGLGLKSIRSVATDSVGVVLPDKLPILLRQVKSEGKRVLALTANACSTSVGCYDPLQEIGSFCNENNIWFHIDGAHGAGALLSAKYKHRLEGIDTADSIIWDMHKMMRTPGVCAAVLIKNHRHLDTAFAQEGDYLFHEKAQPGVDFISRTLECTKAGLGLKSFFALAAKGTEGLKDYIESRYEITLDAYNYINKLPDFHCAVKPQSNILCFRTDQDEKWHLVLRDHLIKEGSFYLSTAVVNRQRYLRMVLMNPLTSLDEIKLLIKRIRRYSVDYG